MRPVRLAGLVLLVIVYTLVPGCNDWLRGPLFNDEIRFWVTVLKFSRQPIPSLHLLYTYPELNTPLPFIVGGWVNRLFGASIQSLRLVNLVLSFCLLNVFLWFPAPIRRVGLALAGLVLFPYFYNASVFFYTDMLTLVFVLGGLWAYLRRVHVLGGLCFAAAICCRQFAVVFPAAVLAFEFFGLWGPGGVAALWRALPRRGYWLWYVGACAVLVGWGLFWHGLAPPAEMARQDYGLAPFYKPGFVLYAAACLGIYYVIPEALMARRLTYYLQFPRKNPALVLAAVLVLGAVTVWFPAVQTLDSYFDVAELGLLDRVLMQVGLAGLAKQAVFAGLALLTVMRFATLKNNLASWLVVLNLLMLGKAHISWDKYLLPTLTTLWFLTLFDAHWRWAGEQKAQDSTLAVSASPRGDRF